MKTIAKPSQVWLPFLWSSEFFIHEIELEVHMVTAWITTTVTLAIAKIASVSIAGPSTALAQNNIHTIHSLSLWAARI